MKKRGLKNNDLLTKVVFALSGILFFIGGMPLLGEDKVIFAIIQILASVLNISMLLEIRSKKTIKKLNYSILSMNVVVGLYVAVDHILSNESYIQYIWFIVAIASFVALIIQIKSNSRSRRRGRRRKLTKALP